MVKSECLNQELFLILSLTSVGRTIVLSRWKNFLDSCLRDEHRCNYLRQNHWSSYEFA